MSKARRKYMREEKARDDHTQQIFTDTGKITERKRNIASIETMQDFKTPVMCPFCLLEGKLQQFLISTKKGISHSRAECPECHNGMMIRSLTVDMTPEEYAEWCFEYSRSGFWKKVPFERWKSRLASIGWAQQFWERYRALKGDSAVENYEDYIMRAQEEQHDDT